MSTHRKKGRLPPFVPLISNGRLSDMVNLTRAIDAMNAAGGKP